jgi:hypothetical protein
MLHIDQVREEALSALEAAIASRQPPAIHAALAFTAELRLATPLIARAHEVLLEVRLNTSLLCVQCSVSWHMVKGVSRILQC